MFLVRTTMPPRMARTIQPQETADVVAFLLSENDYAAGSETLAIDSPRLKTPMRSVIVDPASVEEPPELIAAAPDASKPSGGPTQAELDGAASSGRDWLYHTRDYAGTRYSPLQSIDRSNAWTPAGDLRAAARRRDDVPERAAGLRRNAVRDHRPRDGGGRRRHLQDEVAPPVEAARAGSVVAQPRRRDEGRPPRARNARRLSGVARRRAPATCCGRAAPPIRGWARPSPCRRSSSRTWC